MNRIFQKTFLTGVLLVAIAIICSVLIYDYNSIDTNLDNIHLDQAKKLMIVAHPDDETLWGGAHLLEDDYLVVCITCGPNKTRVKEFVKVMEKTNDQYVMLGYPDKVLGIRSDWKQEESRIYNDLQNIITLKDWDIIVTHNPEGEYGHDHHKKTNRIVTAIYNDYNVQEPLYFFGKYYSKGKMKQLEEEEKPARIDSKLEQIKVDTLIEIYQSQDFIKDMFPQMFPYEEWTLYENMIAKR